MYGIASTPNRLRTPQIVRDLLYAAYQDNQDALAVLETLAERGEVTALRYMGMYCYRADSPERAVAYWTRALPQGCRWSRYYFGKALWIGCGVAQNQLWARRQWLQLCRKHDRVGLLACRILRSLPSQAYLAPASNLGNTPKSGKRPSHLA